VTARIELPYDGQRILVAKRFGAGLTKAIAASFLFSLVERQFPLKADGW
jgi:hypothetical protein